MVKYTYSTKQKEQQLPTATFKHNKNSTIKNPVSLSSFTVVVYPFWISCLCGNLHTVPLNLSIV